MKALYLFIPIMLCLSTIYSKDHEVIELWPQDVPGQAEPKVAPSISKNNKGATIRIDKVTNPALIVYEANPEHRNGAAVIICPGGGYSILAVDKEGYEVAEWLSELGYTAFVLQYRVPRNRKGALQDAQRAIRTVRGMAKDWDIDTDRIGILGFSAGGSLSARASTLYLDADYAPIDSYDSLSARPDFAVLIYPAYLDEGTNHALTPELKVDKNTPPMFIFVAGDDQYANSSLVMSAALKKKKVPFELHILPKGGHGFGMRPGNRAAETWPLLCEEWMQFTVLRDKDPNKL